MAKKKTVRGNESFDSVDEFVKSITNEYGDEAVDSDDGDVKFQTTNLVGLDNILGGGRPLGRIIEIYGPESSGKTALALQMIGVCQRLNGKAMFVDAERTYSEAWCKKFNINTDELVVIDPECGEHGLEIVDKAVRSGVIDIIVVDSVAALVPKAELEGEVGDHHVGLQARMMSQSLRKLTGIVAKSNCTVIFINQLRKKIGVMFGNPETTTGGEALKFYSSIRLDVRRKAWIGDKESPKGIHQRIKCIKNKVAPPFRELEMNFFFRTGYSVAADIFKHATDFSIIKKVPKSSWYEVDCEYYDDEIKLQKKAMLKEIRTNAKLRRALKKEIKHCYNNQEEGDEEG